MKNKLFLMVLLVTAAVCFPLLNNNRVYACEKICAAENKTIKKEVIKKMETDEEEIINSLRGFPFSFSN